MSYAANPSTRFAAVLAGAALVWAFSSDASHAYSVEVSSHIDYSTPPPAGSPPNTQPGQGNGDAGDSIADSATSQISGSASGTGASSSTTVPSKDPDGTEVSTTRDRQDPIPAGSTLKQAKVTITMICEPGKEDPPVQRKAISLTGTGNVSANAHADATCIYLTTVNLGVPPAPLAGKPSSGKSETTTVNKKLCCQ
jgi:hypothetical protein